MIEPKSIAALSLGSARAAPHCFAACLPGFFSCWPLPLPGIPRPRPPKTPAGQRGRAEAPEHQRTPVTPPRALQLSKFSQIPARFLVSAAAEVGPVDFSLASPEPCPHQAQKLTLSSELSDSPLVLYHALWLAVPASRFYLFYHLFFYFLSPLFLTLKLPFF